MKQKKSFTNSLVWGKSGVGGGGREVEQSGKICILFNFQLIKIFRNSQTIILPSPPPSPRLENTFHISMLGYFASTIHHVPPTSQDIKT